MLTKQEIADILTELTYSPEELYRVLREPKVIQGVTLEHVERVGGREGEGSYCYNITKLSRSGEEMYIKHEGYYSSYNGVEFDDGITGFVVVEPFTEQILSWKKV